MADVIVYLDYASYRAAVQALGLVQIRESFENVAM